MTVDNELVLVLCSPSPDAESIAVVQYWRALVAAVVISTGPSKKLATLKAK